MANSRSHWNTTASSRSRCMQLWCAGLSGVQSATPLPMSTLSEGNTSLTIIDTTESTKAAERISWQSLRTQTDKPVGRIIYTHSHQGPHIWAPSVFAGGRDVPVLASAPFSSDLVGVDETIICGA